MPFKLNENLFFKKNDPKDPRLGEFVKALKDLNSTENGLVVLGYADDEGIKNSGGRIGAAQGPDIIRNYLYKMTPHLFKEGRTFFDLGNLDSVKDLPERHGDAKLSVQTLLSKNNSVITLGGGHDYGYPDGAAFLEIFKDQKPVVINFDAHLDVRGVTEKISSGTPFYRLLKDYKNQFDFYEIGIQSQCNSSQHYDWCRTQGGKILSFEEMSLSGKPFPEKILEFLGEEVLLKKRPTYLSIDIDCFSSSVAPGASQVFPTGFMPQDFFPALYVLLKRLDIKVLGIYEVSPPLDQDGRTARLGAQIVFERIFA